MGNIFAPLARVNDGGVAFSIGTGALVSPTKYHGLNIDDDEAIYAVSNGTITHYHEGLPFDTNGRLCVTSSEAVSYFDQGLGFSASGWLVISSSPDHSDQGVWFSSSSAVSTVGGGGNAIVWLLSNNLNLSATVGDDAVMAVGSDTTARVWDETEGLVLATVTAGDPVSEGMRWTGTEFVNDDGAGNKLTPSKIGSNGEEIMLVFDAWADATVYPAGSYVVDFVGVQAKYYSTVAGGTSSGTGVADDTGVTWVLEGNYNNLGGGYLTHVLNEPSATNLFLNSEVPVTQNITTTAQNYTVSVWGTGSVTLSGTATGVATQDSPLTVTATAGTLTCTVAGSLDIVQVETGDVNTSFIPTLSGTVTRAATSFTVPNPLPANDFAIRGRAQLSSFEGTQTLFSAYTDGNNYLAMWITGGSIFLRKRLSGVNKYTIAVATGVALGESFNWGVVLSSSDVDVLSVNTASVTNADTSDLIGLVEFAVGSRDDINEVTGGITDLQVYTGSDLETWASDTTWSEAE